MQNEIRFIELPKIKDLRGNLSFLEDNRHIPFEIERVYWIYDVPGGEERGGHAYKNTAEFIIPLTGGFKVEVNRGEDYFEYDLTQTNKGLYLPPMTWRKISGFLSSSVCLVVTDTKFKDCVYLRDFMEYIENFNKKSNGQY
ncbi:sugar 3,4-ketoisomerase [Plebeiibacterium marinum]|uniref:FdtA/QdtA family cupin domain-containing protein n=1 Tax=Plebeiibacterium marinum TaxID=2992111 RepID=A0AAE3MGT4_9BACT|nr:FdtA/QdtA family cupin domain-containing protein [Plebeiobacterium marinum]MCW3807387.1 FdtA/QdtA family cupin domain-containing protein [Plebeiobacterium marinum]